MSGTAELAQPVPHVRARIRAALAHIEEGGPQIRDGGSDSGPPLYDSADQGWTVERECVSCTLGESKPGYRYYVDHVGIGRRDALPLYLEAVQAAGLDAAIEALASGGRAVVRVAGTYDGDGRRID
jgi:hypothetical protein